MPTPTYAPPAAPTDSELGRHLLTVRGFHFVFGALGDPYARRLRGEADHLSLGELVRGRGPLHRSALGTWVTADGGLAARLLDDPLLGPRHPASEGPQEHVRDNVWETWRTCHVTPLGEDLLPPAAEHDRLAALLGPVLGPGTCTAWQIDAERAVHRVLDGLPSHFDLVSDLARPAVASSLAAVLGLPDAARAVLPDLLAACGPVLDSALCPPRLPVARAMTQALRRVRELMDAAVADHLTAPADGALSALLAVEPDGGRDPGDTVTAAVLSTVVGAETAITTVANAVMALLEHGEQWSLLRADPERAADAVEETLRWTPPVTLRSLITQGEVEIGGETLEADQHVVVLVDAAQRDAELYEDPDRFRLDRPRSPGFTHVALAGRDHLGLVAPLVRVLCTAVLRAVAERLQVLQAEGEPLRRGRSPVVRAALSLRLAQK
ncbi:cytochrome P450 family protein [Streptomyces marianii]|uniref:P450-derived glycosyltransferase activator n=1 Tax=Streptomyces marianii TaxID=1817406 RepID=A0A5R9E1L0_9ACTN|nr:P450-derived glycosyltransferase activator [Streptomyces marianii]TLQ43770.1 P450-derived glycosyltransferase activator [Streptomyces marianii]